MLTLYHHPFSPSSRFIRLILSEYGAAFEEQHVNPWERPQDLLVLNAAGTVPVIVENEGPAICGPGPIMEYLDETRGYAVADKRLMPDHPEARAETRRLVDWCLDKFDREVIGHLVRERIYKQIMPKSAGGGEPDSAALRVARANIHHHLKYFGYLVASRRWLAGDRLSFADFALAAGLSCADYLGEVPWNGEEDIKTWRSALDTKTQKLLDAFRQKADRLGFDDVRIAAADSIPQAGQRLKDFLNKGYHGSMGWMAETSERRSAPAALWPEVRSVIMLAMNYGPDDRPEHHPLAHLKDPGAGGISVYARHRDYHDIIKGRLKELASLLVSRAGGDVKVFVDTAPVMEKPLGEAAGLGWQGKHTNLVSRELGSWFFLGSIFTTLDLPESGAEHDHCGSCRACLDACPTDAFPAPYQLDARRCISYLTIEHAGPIPREFRTAMGNRIYGCDDCLAACPWNKFAQSAREAKLIARKDLVSPRLADLLQLDDAAFRKLFSGSPIKRIGRNRFLRNVLIAAGNSDDVSLLEAVRGYLKDPDETVRGTAVWAFGKLAPAEQFQAEKAKALPAESNEKIIGAKTLISHVTTPSTAVTAKARARLLTLSTALVLISSSAFAEDTGTAAFDAYVDGLKKLGLEVENGNVSYDAGSDTLTITDSSLALSGEIKDLPSEDTDDTTNLTYDISFSSGTVTINGLKHDAGEFSAASWVYSDDTEFKITGASEGEGRLLVDGRLAGLSATDYIFTMPEIPAEDADRQASRWLPFLKATLLTSYEEVKVDSTAMTIEAYTTEDGKDVQVVSGTMQMDGYRMSDASDGIVGEYSIDSMTQTIQTADPNSDQMLTQKTSQGKTIYSDMDIAAFVDLLDPDVPEGDADIVMIREGSAVDYVSQQDLGQGMTMEMTIDRAAIGEITVIKRDSNILGIFDDVLAKKEPAPEELITGIFQFYRSFGLVDARITGINVTVPTPGPEKDIAMSIKEMAMTDVNSDGIGEMMLVGLDAPDLPEGASVKLDWAAIGDIEFAEYTPMRAMISTLMADPNYGEEHPLDVARAFMPRSFGYEIEGLDVTVPDEGQVQIGKSEMTVSTTVPPIPTSYFQRNEGIRVPVSAIDEPEAEALFAALGLDTVVWSDETRLYWDEATLDLRLERLMVDVEGLGRAELSARLANVPKTLFEDPEGQGQMALIVAQFVDASLTFRDAGLASKGVAHIAETQGVPEKVFREALVAQAAEATTPIQNEAFTKMVRDAASKFLNNPGELKITMTPQAPVPLAQILGSMAAPQTIPDLLAVKIEAN
eukprot:g942.t1